VSWTASWSDRSRHLLLCASEGEIVPAALEARLREDRVSRAWLRGTGLLADVELRAYDAEHGTLGQARRITGRVQALMIEGSVGDGSLSLRAVLARETDRGFETIAGEIQKARVIALEVLVTALDEVVAERPARPPTWSAAVEASADAEPAPPIRPKLASVPQATPGVPVPIPIPIPLRPARPEIDLDTPVPEAGDVVDHFAFGRSEVLKSDGDRLHLRVNKDGRIREIALEMLRVTRLPDGDEGKRYFKLERRM
jgi:predicted DNA-binding protein with PD1-like motif